MLATSLVPSGVPLARATGKDGVHHRLWSLTQLGVIETILDAINSKADLPTYAGLALALDAAEAVPRLALGMLFVSPPSAMNDSD